MMGPPVHGKRQKGLRFWFKVFAARDEVYRWKRRPGTKGLVFGSFGVLSKSGPACWPLPKD